MNEDHEKQIRDEFEIWWSAEAPTGWAALDHPKETLWVGYLAAATFKKEFEWERSRGYPKAIVEKWEHDENAGVCHFCGKRWFGGPRHLPTCIVLKALEDIAGEKE